MKIAYNNLDNTMLDLYEVNPDGSKTLYAVVHEDLLQSIETRYNVKDLLDANGEVNIRIITNDF